MRKNSSMGGSSKPAQNEQREAFGFDIESNPTTAGYSRNDYKYCGNQYSGMQNENALINKGRGPTKGNQDHRATGGPSATRDAYRAAPTSALPADESGRDMFMGKSNPQVRTPGGTRAWMPSAGQNYNGNPDMIRIGQSGGPNYGRMEKGNKPATKQGESDFNYGPKSQY